MFDMKDDAAYLLYNTKPNNMKSQKEPVGKGNFDWGYINKHKFTIMYNPEDIRKSTEIKIRSKTKLRDRPKSAGEAMKQPNPILDTVLIKKSISLCSIDDFFSNRRIPLIKPLISEREILKLQLLQEQCRKKRIEPYERTSQKFDVEDIGLRFYPESEDKKSRDRARDGASPLPDSKLKREDDTRKEDKRQKETEEGKPPASSKSKEDTKKGVKDLTPDKLKKASGTGKKGNKEISNEDKTKINKDPKGETKIKSKTSTKSEIKEKKSDAKTENKKKPSKSKEKRTKSEEKISGEDKDKDSNKSDKKGPEKQSSKQKLKSKLSAKDSLPKGDSKHSKDSLPKGDSKHSKDSLPKGDSKHSKDTHRDTSQGKKSDKSDKSGSSKSRKISDASKKRKEKDKDDKEHNKEDQLGNMKPQSEDSGKSKDAPLKSDVSKRDKKTKPGTTSERSSDPLTKEKPHKNTWESAEGKPHKSSVGQKSVKFPNVMQRIRALDSEEKLIPNVEQEVLIFSFRERTEDEIKYFSKSLEKIAFKFRTDGTGEVFYPSGVPAAVITKHNTGMRLTLFSDPGNDPLVSESFISKILAVFDSSGNGVVFNNQGKKILNFNQLEGIFNSPLRSSPYKWQWCDYKILEKQRLKALLRFMAKDQKQPVPAKKGSPTASVSLKKAKPEEKKIEVDEAYEQILAELPYPVPQKTKTKSESQFWGFKPITLKINSEMTLRINGQDDVSISFSTNKIFLRMDLGVKIDPDVVERIDQLAPKRVSDVPCVFGDLQVLSPSLLYLTPASTKDISKTKLSLR